MMFGGPPSPGEQNEDCLFLNVYTPSTEGQPSPVLAMEVGFRRPETFARSRSTMITLEEQGALGGSFGRSAAPIHVSSTRCTARPPRNPPTMPVPSPTHNQKTVCEIGDAWVSKVTTPTRAKPPKTATPEKVPASVPRATRQALNNLHRPRAAGLPKQQ